MTHCAESIDTNEFGVLQHEAKLKFFIITIPKDKLISYIML